MEWHKVAKSQTKLKDVPKNVMGKMKHTHNKNAIAKVFMLLIDTIYLFKRKFKIYYCYLSY